MAKHDKSFEGYWEYWRNRDALRNVADICESNKKIKSKNKGVVPDKESKEVRCDSIFISVFHIIFLMHIKMKDGCKFVHEEIRPDKEALARTFPFNDLMNEIEYEGLCLVDGILPDKRAENDTRIGEITMVIFYAYQHRKEGNETCIQ